MAAAVEQQDGIEQGDTLAFGGVNYEVLSVVVPSSIYTIKKMDVQPKAPPSPQSEENCVIICVNTADLEWRQYCKPHCPHLSDYHRGQWASANPDPLGVNGTNIRAFKEIQRQVSELILKGYEPHGEIGKNQAYRGEMLTQMMIKRPSAEVVYPTAKEL